MANNELNALFGENSNEFNKDVMRISRSLKEMAAQTKNVKDNMQELSDEMKSFSAEIMRVCEYYELLEGTLNRILNNAGQVNSVMAGVINLSSWSPFDMNLIGESVKQLLTVGVGAENVVETLSRLGDIATKLSAPLKELVSLYANLVSQGRLNVAMLEDFSRIGVPVVRELSSQLGVAEEQIRRLTTEGKIGFQELQDIIWRMTNETGLFYQGMYEQSTRMIEQTTRLKEVWTSMQSSSQAGNMEQDFGLTEMYGIFKGIVDIIKAIDDISKAANTIIPHLDKALLLDKIPLLSKIPKPGVFGAIAVAIAGIAGVTYTLATATTSAEEAMLRVKKATDDFNKSTEEEQIRIDLLFKRLRNAEKGTIEYQSAKDSILSQYGNYLKGLAREVELLEDTEAAYKAISKAALDASKTKAFDSGIQNASDTYIEEWSKNSEQIRKAFVKKFEEEKGNKLFSELIKALSNETPFSEDLNSAIGQFTKENVHYFGSASNVETVIKTNFITDYVNNMKKAKEVHDKVIEELSLIWGKGKKENKSTSNDRDHWINKKEEALENINKIDIDVLRRLRDGNTDGIDEKTINDYNKYLTILSQVNEALDIYNNIGNKTTKPDFSHITDEKKQLDNYILSSSITLERERLAIEEDGMQKRLQQSNLEYEEKKQQLDTEYAEQLARYKKLGEAAPESLGETYKERSATNELAKEKRDTAIKADFEKEEQEHQKSLTAYLLTEEEKRVTAIKERYDREREWAKKKLESGDMDATQYDAYLRNVSEAEEGEHLKYLLDQYKSYTDERKEIEDKFNAHISQLTAKNKNGEYDGNIAQAQEQFDKALATIDEKILSSTEVMSRLFGDMSNRSVESLRELAAEAQSLHDYISQGEFEEGTFGLTKENFDLLVQSPDLLEKLKERVEVLNQEADKGEIGFKKMGLALESIFTAGSDTTKLKEGLSQLSEGFSAITQMGNMFAQTLQNIGDLSGSSMFGDIANGLSSVISVANSAMQGAQAGASFGTAGMVVGVTLGIASSVTNILSENKKHRELLKQQIEDNNMAAYLGEMDINRLYRERYEWAKKIGEATLAHIARQGNALKEQSTENSQEQEELWSKLLDTQYKSGEYFKKTGLFGWGKGKIVEQWTSLSNKTWEEIEALAASGKLSEEGMKYYEALKKAREEGDNLAQRQEEYLEEVHELFTGTSYSSLIDSIVDGFKTGKQSAADFADTFEQLMKASVTSALKMFVDDSFRAWYEKWSLLAKDGLTESEIAELRTDYNKIVDDSARKKGELEQITGISISDEKSEEIIDEEKFSQSASAKGFAAMSQESADELNGRFTALQMSGVNLEQAALVRNEFLSGINENSSFINSNVSLINIGVDEIKEINRLSMNHLYKIEKNTALIRETNDLLTKVATNTANL